MARNTSARPKLALVTAGLGCVLLILLAVAAGFQAYAITRTSEADTKTERVLAQLSAMRSVSEELSLAETIRDYASGSANGGGRTTDEASATLTDIGATLGSEAIAPLWAEYRAGLMAEVAAPDATRNASLAQLATRMRPMIDMRVAVLSAEREFCQDLQVRWRKHMYRLAFLTVNMVLVLMACCGALGWLYSAWHRDARARLRGARHTVLRVERDRASFVAAAGHDLRQPLQAMSLFLTTLTHRIADLETLSLIRKVEQAAASMRRMINGLLDVSKLDAGMVAADFETLSLGDIFASFHEEFDRMAEAKGLSLQIGDASDLVVHSDPVLLESIFRNLISNAINYTKTGVVDVSAVAEGQFAVIRVRDTGPGIAPEELGSIFLDFYRTVGTPAGGLGLGLGIVQRSAKLVGGSVKVESQLDAGTTFSVSLPRLNAYIALRPKLKAAPAVLDRTDHGSTASHPASSRVATPVILLLEDNELLRGGLCAHFAAWNMQVVEAASGEDVLARLAQGTLPALDCGIADYDLGPGPTGLEVLRKLSSGEGRSLPAVIITGSTDPAVKRELDSSGYTWFAKPCEPAELHRNILRILQTR